ncbi:MAG TPA: DUF2157 domain-containing protein [Rhizobium sp.]|nr:DUF2157 domain-containing protein [Rhizobium sp.]
MYRGRLRRDFDIWVGKGLVDRSSVEAMLAEYDARRSAFSVGSALMILAAVLISASILLLIAANWEFIPRGVKVLGVLALIWIFHILAAFAIARGAPRLGAALLLLGIMSFGGAIALIGQLYHLSGDAVDAMLLWFAGAVVSAALFRSAVLTVAGGFLSFALFFAVVDEFEWQWDGLYSWSPVAAAAILSALVAWTGANRARNFIYLLILTWLGWLYTLNEAVLTAVLFVVAGTLAFLAVTLTASPVSVIARKTGAEPSFYACALALLGLFLLHFEYDEGRGLALVASATIGFTLLALALDGRDNGAVRYLAYVAFAAEVLYLSFVTIDSMLGTSGFFLLSGLVVAILAFIVVRMEKLFARKISEAGP